MYNGEHTVVSAWGYIVATAHVNRNNFELTIHKLIPHFNDSEQSDWSIGGQYNN